MSKRKRSHRQASAPVTPFFIAAAAYFLACLMLGGGTRAGFLSDVVLQIFAVPLLLWATWRLVDLPEEMGRRQARAAMGICLLAVAIPILQLVPLPPAVWATLPGRADFAGSLEAVGLEAGWRPLSMSPRGTWLSALSLLPPAAVFLSALQLGYAERRRLALAFLAFGVVAAALGLLQVAQGTASRLRFFANTNTTEAVGFFANRNHHSALLYCVLLIAAVVSIAAMSRAMAASSLRSRRAMPQLITAALGLTALVTLVAAQAMARSRAGLALTLVALIGAFAMTYTLQTGRSAMGAGKTAGAGARIGRRALLAAFGLATLFGVQMAFYRVLHRFETSGVTLEGRADWARYTIDAALAYMPFGSGMGSFVPVYQTFERATDNWGALINRAHNDYLEFWLEAGLIGIAVMALFVAWLVVTFVRVWRRGLPNAGQRDNLIACAATIMLGLLLAHSTVDYPLRTTALMAVFALATALIVRPVGQTLVAAASPPEEQEVSGPQSREPEVVLEPHSDPGRFAPLPPRSDWPAAWRRPGRPDRPAMPRLPRNTINDPDEPGGT